MQIELHHCSPQELWNDFIHWYNYVRIRNENKNAVSLNICDFLPNNQELMNFFSKSHLSEIEISSMKYKFIHEIYEEDTLKKHDDFIRNFLIPELDKADKKLRSVLKGDNFILPNSLRIYTSYGFRNTYYNKFDKNNNSVIIIGIQRKNFKELVKNSAIHEYIHTLIEQSLIQKYNVPQELKERIVDLIGNIYFDIPVQEFYKDSFANNYITKETIENNLEKTVQKMMIDYKALQNKKLNQRN